MLRKLASRVGFGVLALTGGFAVGMGCISTNNERTLELAIGTRCTLNSDCTDPNVCVFGTCHAECATSADCAHGERCVKGEKGGASVCQLASESACGASADCSGAQVCGVDGECRDGCKATADCLTGQLCTQGTCADESELDPGTQALPEDPAHVGEGQPCTYNTDCPEDLACIDSSCAYQCNGDKDCSPGQTCVEHFCSVTTPIPIECNNASECGSGFLCVQNKCVAGCTTDADCTSGTRCFGGKCGGPVFDAAYSPDTISATDTSLFAIYQGHILRCPNTGCTPANVEQLFDTVYFGGTFNVPFGGSASTEQLFADGPATFVINSNFSYYQEDIYGCRDLACDDYVETYMYGIAEAKTLRAYQGGVVIYAARDDGKGGLGLTGCTLAAGSTDCVQDFGVPLSGGGGLEYPSTMAVAKGATPADDEVYLGWTSGRIERFAIAECLAGSCAPTVVAQLTDGIGQPVEVTTLRISGTDLFFLATQGGGGEGGGGDYVIDRCVSSSCTPTPYYKGYAFFNPDIAVGGGSVFIADDGNIWKSPITTTP